MATASRPSDAAGSDSAVQTGRDGLETHETRNSPRLPRCYRALRLRAHFPDAFDHKGRHVKGGNLLELPSLFHRQAEAYRHRRARRAIHEEIRRCRCQGRSREEVVAFYFHTHGNNPRFLQTPEVCPGACC
jgi:hypothetical protein